MQKINLRIHEVSLHDKRPEIIKKRMVIPNIIKAIYISQTHGKHSDELGTFLQNHE